MDNTKLELDETVFPCDQCPYKSKKKYNLTVHIEAKHEGIKYPCDQCDYKGIKKFT